MGTSALTSNLPRPAQSFWDLEKSLAACRENVFRLYSESESLHCLTRLCYSGGAVRFENFRLLFGAQFSRPATLAGRGSCCSCLPPHKTRAMGHRSTVAPSRDSFKLLLRFQRQGRLPNRRPQRGTSLPRLSLPRHNPSAQPGVPGQRPLAEPGVQAQVPGRRRRAAPIAQARAP